MKLDVLTIGELLVEIMAKNVDQDFLTPGEFLGPYPSGAPTIFIDQVVKLGLKGGILGCIGEDDFGKNIYERLKKDGVELSLIKKSSDFITGIAFVTYFSNGDRKFIFHLPHSAASQIFPKDVTEELISNIRCLHIMGCSLAISKNVRDTIEKAVDMAHSYGKIISFDPNIRVELGISEDYLSSIKRILSKTNIILSGERELITMTQTKNIEEAINLVKASGIEIIVIKKGKKGAEVYYKNENYKEEPFPVEEVDPTGAGDCFDAGFIASLLEGYHVKEALKRANIIGALSVTKMGPMEGVVDKETVDQLSKLLRR
ncbi:MAG: sugar kinase [Dictyoglomaceae bacterium]